MNDMEKKHAFYTLLHVKNSAFFLSTWHLQHHYLLSSTINVANMNIFNQNISSFGVNECIALVFDSMVDGEMGRLRGPDAYYLLIFWSANKNGMAKCGRKKAPENDSRDSIFRHYDKNDESFIVSMYFAFQIYHFASELFKVIVFSSLSLSHFLLLFVESMRVPWIE